MGRKERKGKEERTTRGRGKKREQQRGRGKKRVQQEGGEERKATLKQGLACHRHDVTRRGKAIDQIPKIDPILTTTRAFMDMFVL